MSEIALPCVAGPPEPARPAVPTESPQPETVIAKPAPDLLHIKMLWGTALDAPIRLQPGEMLALEGLSHSAREHLAGFFSGERQPLPGCLEYLGEDLAIAPLLWSKHRPPEVLVIPPDGALLANFNAWENIWLVACYHHADKAQELMEEVFRLMPELGMDESWPIRKPAALEPWQRLAIAAARVLVLKPRLLVLNNIFEGANTDELRFARQLFRLFQSHLPQMALLYLGDRLAPSIQIKRIPIPS